MQGCLGYLWIRDKSAFYICVFSRNKFIGLDAVYSNLIDDFVYVTLIPAVNHTRQLGYKLSFQKMSYELFCFGGFFQILQ